MSDTEKKTQITPLSMLSLGDVQVLVLRAEQEGARAQNYVSIRRQVSPPEDSTVIPVAQLPQLIELLKQIVAPAIELRTYQTSPDQK
jgi:hypothetical protein